MAKLSEEKILEIQRVYKETGTYSKTAKIVGCSPATVKKYTTISINIQTPIIKKHFQDEIPPAESIIWHSKEYITKLGKLSAEEIEEIKELWGEIL